MKLVFYSGGDEVDNYILDKKTVSLADCRDPLFVFIPSDSFDGECEFEEIVKRFREHGVRRFLYFPVDIPFDDVILREVMKADIVYLGGGNTYYFIKHLRKSKMLSMIQSLALEDKVIAGMSAGAIMFTPTICAAGYPDFDCDENEDNVRSLSAMKLVGFEFFPHYRNSERYDRELKRQSKKIPYPLYAAPDGSGIIKTGDELRFIGKAWCFFKGQKINLAGKKTLLK